jgi:hypothetical protein
VVGSRRWYLKNFYFAVVLCSLMARMSRVLNFQDLRSGVSIPFKSLFNKRHGANGICHHYDGLERVALQKVACVLSESKAFSKW